MPDVLGRWLACSNSGGGMGTRWERDVWPNMAWTTVPHIIGLASLVAGETLLRTRVYWGLAGNTSTNVDHANISQNWAVLGIATTIGNGTESPPDPVSGADTETPPSQRWIWWEARFPRATTWDAEREIAIWDSASAQEPPDSKGMVNAPGNMGAGNALHVWLTFKCKAAWDGTGRGFLWASTVLAIKTVP